MARKQNIFRFNPEPLKALMEEAQIGPRRLADCLNMSASNITGYLMGRVNPSLDTIIAFADFFAVPLDFIFGRCDQQTAEDILRDYHSTFQKLRRSAHEDALQKAVFADKGLRHVIGDDYESPWPYNLVGWICQEPIDWIITPDKEAALESMIRTLTDREQFVVYAHFRDCCTLNEIAAQFRVTRERIRQIEAKAIRKLRHPSKVCLLKEGKTLEEMTEKLNQLQAQIEKQTDILANLKRETATTVQSFRNVSIPIEELNLSVRTDNCLRRADLYTVKDILDFIAEQGPNGLFRFRNFGRKSFSELETVLKERYGINLEQMYEEKIAV